MPSFNSLIELCDSHYVLPKIDHIFKNLNVSGLGFKQLIACTLDYADICARCTFRKFFINIINHIQITIDRAIDARAIIGRAITVAARSCVRAVVAEPVIRYVVGFSANLHDKGGTRVHKHIALTLKAYLT